MHYRQTEQTDRRSLKVSECMREKSPVRQGRTCVALCDITTNCFLIIHVLLMRIVRGAWFEHSLHLNLVNKNKHYDFIATLPQLQHMEDNVFSLNKKTDSYLQLHKRTSSQPAPSIMFYTICSSI